MAKLVAFRSKKMASYILKISHDYLLRINLLEDAGVDQCPHESGTYEKAILTLQ
jgi:hypothetical protein